MKRKLNRKIKVIGVLAAAILAMGILASCGGGKVNEVSPAAERESAGLDSFEMQAVSGEVMTQELFKDAKITMVNVWATYCSPCIAEMPDLQKISEDYKDKGFQVIGLTSNAFDIKDPLMNEIIEETGVTYPVLVASPEIYNGFLQTVSAVPTTVFVDENGKMISEPYVGSRSEESWKEIIDVLLSEV